MAKKKADEKFHWSRDVSRVQVLNGGKAVRIFDHCGLSWVIQAEIDASRRLQQLVADIEAADPECAQRISSELPEEWHERLTRRNGEDDE
jgi:hypothetical protein